LQQQTTGLPGTVTAALPGGTWLTQTDATTTRNTATTFTIAQNFLGSAPSPSTPGGIDGYLTQTGIKTVPGNNVVSNYFRIWYRNVAAGDYTADLSDLYTFTYSLVQGAGSSNRYYSTDGSLLLNLRMYAGTGRDGEVHESFVSDTRSDPNFYPLSDFALSGADTANLSVHLSNVPATTNIFIEGWLAAQQSGSSVVPLPGALVLLGAGLVRLVAYSRRKRALA
jgi:hypothetical protein